MAIHGAPVEGEYVPFPFDELKQLEVERLMPLRNGLIGEVGRVTGEFGSGDADMSYHRGYVDGATRRVLFWRRDTEPVGPTVHVLINDEVTSTTETLRSREFAFSERNFYISRREQTLTRNQVGIAWSRLGLKDGTLLYEQDGGFKYYRKPDTGLLLPVPDQQRPRRLPKLLEWMDTDECYKELAGILHWLTPVTHEPDFMGYVE